jgi:hypothetical protein
MTVRFRLALVAALALLAPTLASAQTWPSEVRRKFVDECLATCTANPKFTAIDRAECPVYCECMVRESQDFMSADDYAALLQAYADKKTTPMRERYEALTSICARRALR